MESSHYTLKVAKSAKGNWNKGTEKQVCVNETFIRGWKHWKPLVTIKRPESRNFLAFNKGLV
jgi:hypothetical protein